VLIAEKRKFQNRTFKSLNIAMCLYFRYSMSPLTGMPRQKKMNQISFKKNYYRPDCQTIQHDRVQYSNKMVKLNTNSKIDEDYKENFLEQVENTSNVDLYCDEKLTDILKMYNISNANARKNRSTIILNDRDAKICKLAENAQKIFKKIKQKLEYGYISDKRQRIVELMMSVLTVCEYSQEIQTVTKSIIISSIAMLDWICAFKNNYFCDENEKRICWFCIIECMKAQRLYTNSYNQDQDIFEIYENSCRMIYGETTMDKQACNYEKGQILANFLIEDDYEDSSYVALLQCYKDKFEDGDEAVLTQCLFTNATQSMKYKCTDMYEEFAEIVMKNSSNTKLNFEIMHDYVAIVSR